MPTHIDHRIPYEEDVEERYRPRLHPRASLPVLWLLAAAVLAILLFIVLRS
ncbi:MAG: hypothetical protein H0X17_14855 [Deltaproteobacteria bacterium]|nr:hypothetical protein [Deltaproteobacteria bacterium]